MAAVLELNFVCYKMLSAEIIVDLLNDYKIGIKVITGMDSWEWENQQKIEQLKQIEHALNHNKIIVIELRNPQVKSMGLYIEKIGNDYKYELWINTEGYPMLDCDSVTSENAGFYEEIYKVILRIKEKLGNVFKIVGIGVETFFHESEDVVGIIRNSSKMTAWLIDGDVEDDTVKKGYKEKSIEGLEMLVLEREE